MFYSRPIVLRNALSEDLYKNFPHLHVAITILVNPILTKNEYYLNLSKDLLKIFVEYYSILYSPENVTFNTHNLRHLVDDVRNFGPLDSFSAFKYENYIGKIKK